jgi:hypothetical protein
MNSVKPLCMTPSPLIFRYLTLECWSLLDDLFMTNEEWMEYAPGSEFVGCSVRHDISVVVTCVLLHTTTSLLIVLPCV